MGMKEFIYRGTDDGRILNSEPYKEIVRCKDCKHGRQYDTNAVDCEYRELATEPDWFCADGKRR